MLSLLRAFLFKVKADFQESTRYPVQLISSLVVGGGILVGIGLGASRVSGQSFAVGTLATFMSIAASGVFNTIAQGSNTTEELPEEKMILPYPLPLQVLLLGLVTSLQMGVALCIGYLTISIFFASGVVAWHIAIGGILLAAFSVIGIGMVMFAIKQLFRRSNGVNTLIILAILSVAFLPLENLNTWSHIIPLVSTTKWVQGSGSLSIAFISGLIWLVIGVLSVAWAEKEATRRGLNSYA